MEVSTWCIHVAVLCAVLLSMAAPMAEGCSCERLHPQQHFCGAAYVIGGKVLKREYVRINTASPSGSHHGASGKHHGLLGGDYGAIEPLPERTRPYPIGGGGLHRLPDEPYPEGLQPQPQGLEPLPMPEGLEPLPQPDGLYPQPEGLYPLPTGLQPLPQGDGLVPLPHPEGFKPIPEGLQPLPEGLEPLPQDEGGLEPFHQPDGLQPLPHPEGLEPLPEGSHSQEVLPPLPLPDDLQPSGEEEATPFMTTTAPHAALIEAFDITTTLPAEGEKATNETFVEPLGNQGGQNPVYGADEPQIHPESMEAWNYKIVYTLKLSHVYKTSLQEDGWKVGDEVELDSPAASGHCGKTNFKTGKNYFIAGHMSSRVSLCDWTQEHHKLTSRQKQGLKTIYGKSCDVCQIYACPTHRHCKKPKENRSTTCLYDASQVHIGGPYSPYDCVASHSRCTLRGGSKCKWQKNNDYHDCMKHQLP